MDGWTVEGLSISSHTIHADRANHPGSRQTFSLSTMATKKLVERVFCHGPGGRNGGRRGARGTTENKKESNYIIYFINTSRRLVHSKFFSKLAKTIIETVRSAFLKVCLFFPFCSLRCCMSFFSFAAPVLAKGLCESSSALEYHPSLRQRLNLCFPNVLVLVSR
jgi:hypothetical protein